MAKMVNTTNGSFYFCVHVYNLVNTYTFHVHIPLNQHVYMFVYMFTFFVYNTLIFVYKYTKL